MNACNIFTFFKLFFCIHKMPHVLYDVLYICLPTIPESTISVIHVSMAPQPIICIAYVCLKHLKLYNLPHVIANNTSKYPICAICVPTTPQHIQYVVYNCFSMQVILNSFFYVCITYVFLCISRVYHYFCYLLIIVSIFRFRCPPKRVHCYPPKMYDPHTCGCVCDSVQNCCESSGVCNFAFNHDTCE